MHWAHRHADRVAAIAYMETIVMPVTWDDWPEAARGIFQGFRSEKGEELILERNMFIEGVNMLLTERTEIGAMLDARGGDLNRLIKDMNNNAVQAVVNGSAVKAAAFTGDTTIDVVEQEEVVRKARLLILEATFLDDGGYGAIVEALKAKAAA